MESQKYTQELWCDCCVVVVDTCCMTLDFLLFYHFKSESYGDR